MKILAIILLLYLSLPASHIHQLSSQHLQPHGKSLYYQASLYISGAKSHAQVMSSRLLAGLENVDPKATLSTIDLVKLLTNQCDIKVEESAVLERERTESQISAVIDGFAKKINSLIESINRENSSLLDKINDLELRLNTTSSYLEQVIHTSRADTFDALKTLSKEKSKCQCLPYNPREPVSCGKCGNTFYNRSNLEAHNPFCNPTDSVLEPMIASIQPDDRHPQIQSPQACTFCGSVFISLGELYFHTQSHHANVQPHPCNLGDETFPNRNGAEIHINRAHEDRNLSCVLINNFNVQETIKCYKCDTTFQTYNDLKTHHQYIHQISSVFPTMTTFSVTIHQKGRRVLKSIAVIVNKFSTI